MIKASGRIKFASPDNVDSPDIQFATFPVDNALECRIKLWNVNVSSDLKLTLYGSNTGGNENEGEVSVLNEIYGPFEGDLTIEIPRPFLCFGFQLDQTQNPSIAGSIEFNFAVLHPSPE